MGPSACFDDKSFGPFDFTLTFEKIVLSILPSAIFIALAISRSVFLTRNPSVAGVDTLQYAKLAATTIYAALQLGLLVLVTVDFVAVDGILISSAALAFAAAICMVALSFLEHSRSPRPAILLNVYLLLTVLFDIAQTRSLWLSALSHQNLHYVRLFTATTVWKAVLILLESTQKQRWLLQLDQKSHSPEETSGLYGLGTFFWLTSLFLSGFKKALTMSDLFALDRTVSAEVLQASFYRYTDEALLNGKSNALAKSLGRALVVPLLLPVAPRIFLVALGLSQPLLIKTLLTHLEKPETSSTANSGYGLIGATVLIYSGIPIATALYWYLHERALYMVRGCLVSAVYHKTTQAPVSASDDSAAVTLMSSDIERIRTGLMSLHEFWASPIQAAVACWLLQRQLGAAFAAPVVVIAICVACSVLMMRFIGPRQVAWMQRIQKRVGHTANVIGNMKHLKISGMTGAVEESVQQLRVDELKVGGEFRVFVLVAVAIGFTPVLLGPVFTFAVTTRSLDATTIFTSISYLLLLSEPLSNLFQMAPELLAAFACLGRVQAFLEKDARKDSRKDANLVVPSEKRDGKDTELPAITIGNASFGWTEDVMTLMNINCSIPLGLTIVVGPVASGKSTFCKALLGEMPVVKGRVIMHTKFHRVGFCEQVPFLPNASIRDTIVGFSAFNEERYAAVLESVMLLRDLELLAQGDQTRIGSSGIALSGGQKQRISLARALYLQCDLLILDDVLSGLDSDTEGHVFRRVFGPEGILKQRNSTAVLCTHAVRHLPSAEHIIALGSDGTMVEQGRFDDLFKSDGKIRNLEIEQRTTSTQSASPCQEEIQRTRIADIPTPVTQPDEERPAGMMSDRAVFRHYCRSIGGFWLTSFVIFGMLCGLLYNVPSIWLNFWSKDVTSDRPRRTTSFYVGLYALYQCLALLTLIVEAAIGMLIIVRNSGTNLHEKALKTLISAPLRFFATTDTGVVTNLFSQDMTLIDGELPHALTNTSLEFWNAMGAAIVIATSSPYVVITYPFVMATLYGVQKFYLRTSRQLRLLDLEAKSPLYTHFLDTIKGVVTLRSFGWTEDSISFNNTLLDTSQRPAYLLSMVQRWLAFVLGMVTAVIAVLVVTLATQLRPTTGFTGASMVSLMTFGRTLANLVQMYTLLETSIGAVGRLKSFNDNTAPEDLPGEHYFPPAWWPGKGRIVISDVSATYGDPSSGSSAGLDQYALRDLNLTIEPGEKVAICGRTGSGKSSLVLLLLRLLDPLPTCADKITIDDVPLSTIDRSTLRRRIIALPQDPVFLPDGMTIRKNLDPSAAASDDECQAVLEAVGLWGFIYDRGGLLAEMLADNVLSHGQKQLFSLARVVLRRRLRGLGGGGLLILDEFNSSVDSETERTMHDIILHEFDGYTVIMVSHRLEMVMGFDRVVVMDAGRVVEQGPPGGLVEKEGGWVRDPRIAGKTEEVMK